MSSTAERSTAPALHGSGAVRLVAALLCTLVLTACGEGKDDEGATRGEQNSKALRERLGDVQRDR